MPSLVVAPTVELNVVAPLPVEMVKGFPAPDALRVPQNVSAPPFVVMLVPVPMLVGDSDPDVPKESPTPEAAILITTPLLPVIEVAAHNVTFDAAPLIVPSGTFKLPPLVQTAAAVKTVVLPAPAC